MDQQPQSGDGAAASSRADWLSVLAKAPLPALEGAMAGLGTPPQFEWLRQPEIGLVIVRGRAGGVGERFNLGETPVTRAAIRLADGTMGVGYVLGRSSRHAELVAIADACLQQPAESGRVRDQVVEPMRRLTAERNAATARKSAATQVEFFTVARESGA